MKTSGKQVKRGHFYLKLLRCEINENMRYYYVAGCANGPDKPNPALWLATRPAGKMELSIASLLGLPAVFPEERLSLNRVH